MRRSRTGEPEYEEAVTGIARKRFGINYLYPYQQLVISNILESRDHRRQLVILPTGAGKSLCFMVPALLLPGITIVIYPLLSLMNDQKQRLEQAGIPAELLRGGQSSAERRGIFARLAEGSSRMLLANPEVLAGEAVTDGLRSMHISHIVIDEAHIIDEWGTTFRPAYLRLGQIIRGLHVERVTAFTATASGETIKTIRGSLFGDAPIHLVHGDTDRPNLYYQIVPTIAKEHDLRRLLNSVPKPALIFCGRRETTEILARVSRIDMKTKNIFSYHAGMSRTQRERIEQWFHASADGVLFATKAFGLGIDKKGIRTVIHYDLPDTLAAYLQEAGRAGRDGSRAFAVMLVTPQESLLHPDKDVREYVTEGHRCRRETLLRRFSIHEPESCFGCDVCSGTRIESPDGKEQILQTVRKNNAQLSMGQLVELLSGAPFSSRRFSMRYGFGVLRSWHREEIRAAAEYLLADPSGLISLKGGRIFFRRRGPAAEG